MIQTLEKTPLTLFAFDGTPDYDLLKSNRILKPGHILPHISCEDIESVLNNEGYGYRSLIMSELNQLEKTPIRGLREKLYIIDTTYLESPALCELIFMQREQGFRTNGVGTGMTLDFDEADLDGTMRQLIVYRPHAEIFSDIIVSAGRYQQTSLLNPASDPMRKRFVYSAAFVAENMVQLGRFYVNPSYHGSRIGMRSYFFALGFLFNKLKHQTGGFYGKLTIPFCYEYGGCRGTDMIQSNVADHWTDGRDMLWVGDTYKRHVTHQRADNLKRSLAEESNRFPWDLIVPPYGNMYQKVVESLADIHWSDGTRDETFGNATEFGMFIRTSSFKKDRVEEFSKQFA